MAALGSVSGAEPSGKFILPTCTQITRTNHQAVTQAYNKVILEKQNERKQTSDPPITSLPPELLCKIFEKLSLREKLICSRVCWLFYTIIIHTPYLLKSHLSDFGQPPTLKTWAATSSRFLLEFLEKVRSPKKTLTSLQWSSFQKRSLGLICNIADRFFCHEISYHPALVDKFYNGDYFGFFRSLRLCPYIETLEEARCFSSTTCQSDVYIMTEDVGFESTKFSFVDAKSHRVLENLELCVADLIRQLGDSELVDRFLSSQGKVSVAYHSEQLVTMILDNQWVLWANKKPNKDGSYEPVCSTFFSDKQSVKVSNQVGPWVFCYFTDLEGNNKIVAIHTEQYKILDLILPEVISPRAFNLNVQSDGKHLFYHGPIQYFVCSVIEARSKNFEKDVLYLKLEWSTPMGEPPFFNIAYLNKQFLVLGKRDTGEGPESREYQLFDTKKQKQILSFRGRKHVRAMTTPYGITTATFDEKNARFSIVREEGDEFREENINPFENGKPFDCDLLDICFGLDGVWFLVDGKDGEKRLWKGTFDLKRLLNPCVKQEHYAALCESDPTLWNVTIPFPPSPPPPSEELKSPHQSEIKLKQALGEVKLRPWSKVCNIKKFSDADKAKVKSLKKSIEGVKLKPLPPKPPGYKKRSSVQAERPSQKARTDVKFRPSPPPKTKKPEKTLSSEKKSRSFFKVIRNSFESIVNWIQELFSGIRIKCREWARKWAD